jgi:glycosyltransferase involved in cell wall biosynthesis
MNILILANKTPYPPNDGGAMATFNLAIGLAKAGAKVSLLAISTPKHPGSPLSFPQHFKDLIHVETVFVDTTISPYAALHNLLFSSKPYNAVRFDSLSFHQLIESKLAATKYDIVQLEGAYLEPYIATIRRHFSGPISLRAHNVEGEIWRRAAANQVNPLKRWYFRLLSKRIRKLETSLLANVDLLIPITHRDQDHLYSMGFNGPSITSPVGYDLEQLNDDVKDFEFPSVFHLGGLDWLPNQEGLLWFLANCWESILSSVPEAKFYIAGRNASNGFIQKILRFKGVIFCGEISSASEFMQSKGIMVVPLLCGGGMRVKIVEGMALGKSIVSTPIGAEGIDAVDGKQIVIASTPEGFSEKVVDLLLNVDKTRHIGQSASVFAKSTFDNNLLSHKLLGFYRTVLQK